MKRSARLLVLLLLTSFLASCNKLANLGIEEGYIPVNGAKLYYKTLGEGEPILVVHGGPGLGHNYLLPHFEALAKNHKLIFYDQRHAGKSIGEETVSNIPMEAMVEDIEELRKAFNIDKLHLLSHSFGSLFTIQYASQFPSHIKSLTLLEPYPISSALGYQMFMNVMRKASQEEARRFKEVKASLAFKRSEAKAVQQFLYYYYSPFYYNPESRQVQDFSYFNEEFAQKYTTTNQFININNFSYNLEERLELISCPTLIIYGEADVVPVENHSIIERSIKKSKAVMIKKSGHFGYLENSDSYFKAIKEFLRDPDKYTKK